MLPKKVKEKLLFLIETVSPYTQDNILIVAKTKIDASFPTAQFSAEGYHKPNRLDVSEKSGGILVYINSSRPSRQLH